MPVLHSPAAHELGLGSATPQELPTTGSLVLIQMEVKNFYQVIPLINNFQATTHKGTVLSNTNNGKSHNKIHSKSKHFHSFQNISQIPQGKEEFHV